MFIYIIKNKIAFYDDPEDYTAKKLYKKLLKEYGCEPVIIKLEPDENNEFAVTAEITPAQVLHLICPIKCIRGNLKTKQVKKLLNIICYII